MYGQRNENMIVREYIQLIKGLAFDRLVAGRLLGCSNLWTESIE